MDSGRPHPAHRRGRGGQNGGPPATSTSIFASGRTPIFDREGADLSCAVPVSFATAALGGTVDVPTLDGEVNLKIPAETQSGRVFRLRGKGVKPVRGSVQGDLYCSVEIETPVNLTRQQKALLEKFNEALVSGGESIGPGRVPGPTASRRFFERLSS